MGRERQRLVAIAIGALAGASLRWAVFTSVAAGRFPWPVLVVNTLGSFLLGILLAAQRSTPTSALILRDGGGIGFCGSLTTFSTFSVEVVQLARDGDGWLAAAYTVASVGLTIVAFVAGGRAVRSAGHSAARR